MKLKCFTADLVKGTGGKILEFDECRIARRKTMEETPGVKVDGYSDITRPARHNENFTFNLEIKNNGQIRKVHAILITNINGEKVL